MTKKQMNNSNGIIWQYHRLRRPLADENSCSNRLCGCNVDAVDRGS